MQFTLKCTTKIRWIDGDSAYESDMWWSIKEWKWQNLGGGWYWYSLSNFFSFTVVHNSIKHNKMFDKKILPTKETLILDAFTGEFY